MYAAPSSPFSYSIPNSPPKISTWCFSMFSVPEIYLEWCDKMQIPSWYLEIQTQRSVVDSKHHKWAGENRRTTEAGQAVQDGGSNTGPGATEGPKILNKKQRRGRGNDPKILSFDVAALQISNIFIFDTWTVLLTLELTHSLRRSLVINYY